MKSIELTQKQAKQFKNKTKHLKHQKPHQYETVRIKDGKIVLILYYTNKLVYNDNKETLNVLSRIFRNKKFKSKKPKKRKRGYHQNAYYNKDISTKNYQYIIGSDETGKGEWYGPLVVCAVSTSRGDILKLKEIGVKDSKKLKPSQINGLYSKILKLDINYKVLTLVPYSYNRIYNQFKSEGKNLNHLLAYLHSKAITEVLKETSTTDVLVVIDKFDKKKMDSYLDINDKIDVVQETNGEKYIPVAASSIIAKYHYEKTLKTIEKRYNINLRKTKPWKIDRDIVDKVAKTHFKNVKKY